jgi:hypothetical protein
MKEQPKNRNWIWFFVVMAVLAVIAAAIPLIYNLRQQLTLAELQAARERWQQNGPKSYVMEYSKHGSATGSFVVTVRAGQVESVIMKTSPEDVGRPIEKRQYGYHDILGIMEDIERFLEMDAQPGAPRAFNRAGFDPQTGQLRHYTRSVSATGQSLQILVTRLEPLAP